MPTRKAHARWEGSLKQGLVCEARVRGTDQAAFARHAETAKASCPVSRALSGTEITLEARLAAK